jgi:glycosyltransferase involved in cell wall biosynthesis
MAGYFGAASLARLGFAYLGAASRLGRRLRRGPRPDLLVTGFNGQLDVLLARLIAGRRTPLLFAPLVTLTETLVDDRGVYARGGLPARLAARLDRRTLETPDLVLLDTEAHRAWVAERVTARARTATLYLGAEPAFVPVPVRPRTARDPLRVLFYGQYVPLHGAPAIVEAAALIGPGQGIELTMIGTGPDRAAAEEVARRRGCPHVRFEDWVAYESLPARLADADVALGIFGRTVKARLVIPTKVYQAAAVGRPIVTADTPALREVFTPGDDVLAVPRGDPGAIAGALRRLRDDPALGARLGSAAARLLGEHLDARAQGARMRAVLAEAFPEVAARLPAVTVPRPLAGARAAS